MDFVEATAARKILTDLRDDNRPQEVRKMARLITDHFHKTIGVICSAANWASPVMWAHYADKHFGVALGFDVPDSLLSQIHYTNEY